MKRKPSNIYLILDSHFAQILLVTCVLGTILHVLHAYFFFSIYRDEATQIAAATSLLDGFGLTIPKTLPGSPKFFVREPMVAFPLGYPLIFSGLLAVFNDIVLARIAAILIAAAAFYAAVYILFYHLRAVLGSISAIAVPVFWAFLWSPLQQLNTAEKLALGFFVLALSLSFVACLRMRCSELYFASALSMGISVACRYAYWPLVVVIPFSLALSHLRMWPKRRLISIILLSLGIPTLMMTAISLFNTYYAGRATLFRQMPAPREWHLENALRCDPFPASAIGVSQSLDWLGPKVPAILTREAKHLLGWCVSIVLVLLIFRSLALIGSMQHLQKGSENRLDSTGNRFLVYCAFLSCILTLCMLAYLSVGGPISYPEFAREYGWVPLQERRYFAAIHPFLATLTIISFQVLWASSKRLRPIVITLSIMLLMPVAGNSLKDWAGVLLRYKGWGSAVGKTNVRLSYNFCRHNIREGNRCVYLWTRRSDERCSEFMGGAFPLHAENLSAMKLPDSGKLIVVFEPNLKSMLCTWVATGVHSDTKIEYSVVNVSGHRVAAIVHRLQ